MLNKDVADFKFLKNKLTGKWVILAPGRSKRTNIKIPVETCPFCIGKESEGPEVYRIGGSTGDSNWKVRVVPNKFPFTIYHEVVIHSPDHHKNFEELPQEQVELILKTYRHRFNFHKNHGQVYIFHNRGHEGGESLPHPHTQITVVPKEVYLDIRPLDTTDIIQNKAKFFHKIFPRSDENKQEILETNLFFIFCPETSDWPDEVWIAPKTTGQFFGSINDKEIADLAFSLSRIIQILDIRHGSEFSFNFYIYPGKNWYLRLIPRIKILGGFELGTGIIVNTQDPKETFEFIKEHFQQPDHKKIKSSHQAEYRKSV